MSLAGISGAIQHPAGGKDSKDQQGRGSANLRGRALRVERSYAGSCPHSPMTTRPHPRPVNWSRLHQRFRCFDHVGWPFWNLPGNRRFSARTARSAFGSIDTCAREDANWLVGRSIGSNFHMSTR
jgi:hypothetical protein